MASINREIMGKIMQMKQLQRLYFHRTAKESGLYFGQLPILWYIGENKGCTQREIAEALGVTPASIALSTKRMQKAGLLDKQTDAQDLRCNRLSLTQKGLEYCCDCSARFHHLDESMLNGFAPDQLNDFNEMLGIIVGNLCDLLGIEPMKNVFEIMKAGNMMDQDEESGDKGTEIIENLL